MTPYDISTDLARLDLDVIHGYLARSYWSPGIPKDLVARAVANSLCFGVYHGTTQVGFARVITDCASFAYLVDVFVLEAHRGQGLSKRLVAEILAHPDLQGLRRVLLADIQRVQKPRRVRHDGLELGKAAREVSWEDGVAPIAGIQPRASPTAAHARRA